MVSIVGQADRTIREGPRSMIDYTESLEGIDEGRLAGFFVGWPNPPSPAVHLRLLRGSGHVVLAIDRQSGAVVGYVTAISDGVLSAYISYLEVVPAYQKRGIGAGLMERMMARLAGLYTVSLTCDPEMRVFYERFGMRATTGMMRHDYQRQSGE